MNWKLILGLLLIYGGTKEFLDEFNDYKLGRTNYNPIYAELGCLTLVILGIYLIFKSRIKRKF